MDRDIEREIYRLFNARRVNGLKIGRKTLKYLEEHGWRILRVKEKTANSMIVQKTRIPKVAKVMEINPDWKEIYIY